MQISALFLSDDASPRHKFLSNTVPIWSLLRRLSHRIYQNLIIPMGKRRNLMLSWIFAPISPPTWHSFFYSTQSPIWRTTLHLLAPHKRQYAIISPKNIITISYIYHLSPSTPKLRNKKIETKKGEGRKKTKAPLQEKKKKRQPPILMEYSNSLDSLRGFFKSTSQQISTRSYSLCAVGWGTHWICLVHKKNPSVVEQHQHHVVVCHVVFFLCCRCFFFFFSSFPLFFTIFFGFGFVGFSHARYTPTNEKEWWKGAQLVVTIKSFIITTTVDTLCESELFVCKWLFLDCGIDLGKDF